MRVGIIGGGESGVGAALLAIKVGDVPFVSDYGTINPVFRQSLIENNVHFEEGGHTFDILVTSDLIVKSPGVRDDTPIVISLKDHGKSVISELEYGYRFCSGRIIAITGSNGKTTTTNLIYHILITAGIDAVKGGNLGTSLSSLLIERPYDVYVLEVSSFQLDDIVLFKPNIAVLLNITPDHLDRYDYNFSLYADSKMRITLNQDSSDAFYYGSEIESIDSRLSFVRSEKFPISYEHLVMNEFSISNPFLRGRHNQMNASCAIEVARKLNIRDANIERGLTSFRNDDHRLQSVCKIDGVEWINDSKATNVDATYFALEAMSAPIIWIAGGVDKGNDYNTLKPLVRQNVKVLICLGEDSEKLKKSFSHYVDHFIKVTSMKDALDESEHHAVEGDVVLLSPACASFDLFENYKDRGNQFVSGVWELLRKRK